eukprot:TRINITY_DN5057_c0_g1_i1.p2 TRINITY_DN5057_c0_g1~~TRINITY_DN5057_c0_g1_i1.p2  ORF type:complete len:663 (+),score=158.62 TRINITY_DN5057_c0_g1_i1:81-2069(+)
MPPPEPSALAPGGPDSSYYPRTGRQVLNQMSRMMREQQEKARGIADVTAAAARPTPLVSPIPIVPMTKQQTALSAANRAPQGGEGVERVQGHPWVTALRAKAEWQWQLPAAGALEEHFVFLFMGASNIVGRQRVEDGPNVFKTPLPGPAWACDPSGRMIKRCQEPLHPHDGEGTGIGPIRAFARRVMRNLPKAHNQGAGVFLVPAGCAHGDMSLNAWAPDGVLYSVAVARARTCAQAVGGRVAGVLIHQGEADACNAEDAAKYETRIREMISNIRVDLEDPQLPIIVGEIGEGFLCRQSAMPDAWQHAREINRALKKLGDLPWTRCIRASSSSMDDLLHYDHTGMEEFGTRAAEEWERMWKERSRGERRLAPDGIAYTLDGWKKQFKGLVAGKIPWATAPTYLKDDDGPGAAAPWAIDNDVKPLHEAPDPWLPPHLSRGTTVIAHSLVGAKELNGLKGTVVRGRPDGRVVIVFDMVGEKAIKPENMRIEQPAGPPRPTAGPVGPVGPATRPIGPAVGPMRPGEEPAAAPAADDAGPQPPKGLPYAVGDEVEVERSNGRWAKGTVKKMQLRDDRWSYVVALAEDRDMFKYIDIDRAHERLRRKFYPRREGKGDEKGGKGGKGDEGEKRKRDDDAGVDKRRRGGGDDAEEGVSWRDRRRRGREG